MNKLVAYLDDPQLKEDFVEEIEKHRKADQILQGTYGKGSGKGWKGCAVGCSIHSLNRLQGKQYQTGDHSVYETELGIPQALAYLEDRIFEGLSIEESKLWPSRFANAITPGSDLSLVLPKFMVWLMKDLEQYTTDYPDVLASLRQVAKLYRRIIQGGTVSDGEWTSAADAAARAADAADAAARAAYAAAYAAARAADAADAAAYTKMADKLIQILEESAV